jgi:hypothetical protein
MSASYNRSFMKHRDPLDGPNTAAMVEEARGRNDRRLMRLLGCDELVWERTNPYWFIGSDEERWEAWAAEDRAFMLGYGAQSEASALVLKAPTRRTVIV